ncbi:hypothetical protein BH10ACI3_BH10ACI3_02080 [soil metagenome]
MIRNVPFTGVLILLSALLAFGQLAETQDTKIPWSMTVVVMDGADQVKQAEIPVKEAVAFIEAHTRFKFEVSYVVAPDDHGYTPYKTGTGRKTETRYAMMAWDVPKSVIDLLPTSTSYLFLYKLFGKKPAQAGSALGLDFGIIKKRKPRPYATVPVDMWWFVNTPKQGFKSWAAQVLTHEIINTIQAKLEARPYLCGQLGATPGTPANVYESERLTKISDKCYAKLGNNAN